MSDQIPFHHIRTAIFECPTQAGFADLIGYSQATVSRWENGVEPDRAAMSRIREVARRRGIDWDDRWFFEVPQESGA